MRTILALFQNLVSCLCREHLKQRLFLRYLPFGQIPRQHIMYPLRWKHSHNGLQRMMQSVPNQSLMTFFVKQGSCPSRQWTTRQFWNRAIVFMLKRFESVCFEDISTCRENVRARSVSTPPAGGSTIS